jgi:predicted RNase H-like HicB family nuclease
VERRKYEIVLIKNEGGWVVAECPELPGCLSQGGTAAEALDNIQEAIAAWSWAESQNAKLTSAERPTILEP